MNDIAEIPSDLLSSKVIRFPELEDLIFDELRYSNFNILWTRFGVDEGFFPMGFIGTVLPIEYLSGNTKIAACLGDIPGFLSMGENPKFPANIPSGLNGHLDLLSTGTSSVLSTEVKNSRLSLYPNALSNITAVLPSYI